MKFNLVFMFSFLLIVGCATDDDICTNSGSASGCPTTAACGCSDKNKTACESDYCCKWTVGQGCGCN